MRDAEEGGEVRQSLVVLGEKVRNYKIFVWVCKFKEITAQGQQERAGLFLRSHSFTNTYPQESAVGDFGDDYILTASMGGRLAPSR